MVVQCRPPRRVSPDSLSITDSEAESVSKYSSPTRLVMSPTEDRQAKRTPPLAEPPDRQHRSSDMMDTALRSPTFSGAGSVTSNHHHHQPTPSLNGSVKAYRKSIKQHVQNTIMAAVPMSSSIQANGVLNPQSTAKAFTRVVARSRAFFNLSHSIYKVYSWQHIPTSCLCVIAWVVLCKWKGPCGSICLLTLYKKYRFISNVAHVSTACIHRLVVFPRGCPIDSGITSFGATL